MIVEKLLKLQTQLRDAWKLAYDLEKESDNPEIKAMFSEINGVINSLEVKLYDVERIVTK